MDWNEDGKKDLVIGDSKGIIYLFINSGTDKKPVFETRKQLVVDGKPFKWANTRTKPDVTDWNNDGKKDLIIGEERGKVLLLLNVGTNEEPVFGKVVPIKDGNRDLNALSRVDPCVYDWNGDGKKDLVCANEGGQILFFENKGTDKEPKFSGKVILKAKGFPLCDKNAYRARADLNGDGTKEYIRSNRSRALVITSGKNEIFLKKDKARYTSKNGNCAIKIVDWNGDKKPDILIGDFDGSVYIALNEGKKTELKFADMKQVKAGAKVVNGGTGVVADFVDWDKDGNKDLLCIDCNGNGVFYRNTGKIKRPKFRRGKKAVKESSVICAGYRSRIEIADWNGDGFADLIYGVTSNIDGKGRIYIFPIRRQ